MALGLMSGAVRQQSLLQCASCMALTPPREDGKASLDLHRAFRRWKEKSRLHQPPMRLKGRSLWRRKSRVDEGSSGSDVQRGSKIKPTRQIKSHSVLEPVSRRNRPIKPPEYGIRYR
jgi:hypothetical protein